VAFQNGAVGLIWFVIYVISPHPHVKHYHIKQNVKGEFFLSEKHCCNSIPELVNYHKHNGGGLASRLKASPCNRPVPATAGLSHGMYRVGFLMGKISAKHNIINSEFCPDSQSI
jgi:tyrosine-protein kinase Tec